MAKSYLNVTQVGRDVIYHRYIEDGERKEERINFRPFLGVDASPGAKTSFTTIHGKPIEHRVFESISEMRNWKKENGDYIDIHGDISPLYQFIALNYPGQVLPQMNHMRIFNLDVEVQCTKGFPKPEDAAWPISALTVEEIISGKITAFGYKENYIPTEDDVTYIFCEDEKDLIIKFVDFWSSAYPDIYTGWNTEGFDIPYIVTRINKIMPTNYVLQLSPIRKVSAHKYTDNFGNEQIGYSIEGIVHYDYKNLYEKFCVEPREQKSLSYIAKVELGDDKLDYDGPLNELYENDFQTYMSYNIKDVRLVTAIDKKRNYLALAITMTYMAKCDFKDVFGTVGIWDAYLYNILLSKKILAPPKKSNIKGQFPGGFVEDPRRGLNYWVMVRDIASSYPNSIITYNMSPETIVDESILPDELKNIAMQFGNIESCLDPDVLMERVQPVLDRYDVCMAPNGTFYRRDKIGFIPEIVAEIFAGRKGAKRSIKELDVLEKTPDIKNQIASLDAIQGAFKVFMNSLYGAMSNEWFRYFDLRIAAAITSAGQTSVRGAARYIEKKLPDVKNIYTDTDSVFLDMVPTLNKRFGDELPDNETVVHFLLKYSDMVLDPVLKEFFNKLTDGLNTKQKTLTMEHESISNVCLFREKKMYAMRLLENEGTFYFDKTKLKIKGIEVVRTSTPQFVRDALKRTLELIFETADQKAVKDYLDSQHVIFKTLPFEKVAFPRGVNEFNKYIGQTKGVPLAPRAAIVFNKFVKMMNLEDKYQLIHEGDKVKYCYLKEPNRVGSNAIACLDKFPVEFDRMCPIDYDLQWEKAYMNPMEKIFELIGWSMNNKAVSLEDFFS